MDKNQVENLVINNAVNGLTMLNAISKVKNVTDVVIDALEENNFTFEEAISILTGIANPLAEVIEKDPSKRTKLVKRAD
ncbi:hypothetical protein [Rummeliibacillus sp. POC4]|uniref:hypothetical protein n=1 Tax=Rummeliibacillus sp. POC4 TaxID=2305899 RepID=UPI000E66ED21|nr:hypothetical protein [Rummeliibacillus sp. POC4]RIJ63122.1 hypothetical protein D1606_16605 [Rummeliibacillus sp. POC4]